MVYTDKERDTPEGTFDTVWHEGRFDCFRESEDAYKIYAVGAGSYRVQVRDGGAKARMALTGAVWAQPPDLGFYRLERAWPQAVAYLEMRTGGFHLERMSPTRFMLNLSDSALNFDIISGPKNAILVVEEVKDDGE